MTEAPAPTAPPTVAPLPYHRLAHLEPRAARWWRPLTTVLVVLGLYLPAAVLAFVVLALATFAVPGIPMPSAEFEDPRNPVDIAVLFGSLALLVPAVVLGVRWGGGRRGTIHSVVGRVRWAMLLKAAAVVVPLYLALSWGLYLLDPAAESPAGRFDATLLVVLAVVVVLVPLQCAAEEYAFRGLPLQALGTWLRSPVWGIVLPVPLFMAGHGYDWVGQVDIAVFALCMGFLVWKTGGLELAIVAHTANNLAAMTIAPLDTDSLAQGAIDPVVLLMTVPTTLVVTAGMTVWVSRRHGLRPLEPLRGTGGPARPQ
ncbi:type II CAAX endopeptidase family protein [Pseudonocardia nematodicida]|uniref:Type II CAAX endopeptidase family protein n=1 Tax=Pseudonocardia nematodicida TaxID=1206997 RepID=A0ABV1KKD5_9PSEU